MTLATDRASWALRLPRDIIILIPEEFECDRHIPGTIARYASKEGRVLYERTGSTEEQSSEADATPSILKSED